MRPASHVQTAIEALAAIYTTVKPADSTLSAFFRARRYIGSKDRTRIAELVYATLRHHARIGWWLQRVGLPEDARTSVLCWLFLEGRSFEEVREWCGGGEYAPERLTRDEDEKLRKLEGKSIEHTHMPEDVKLECPDWAKEKLQARFGASFADEMRALLQPAPLDVRINTLKTDIDGAIKALREDRIEAVPGKLSPVSLRITGRPPLAASKAFRDGLIEIQDEGSQLVAALIAAKPGEQVVDFCAGAGGKTLAMAAAMNNKGRVVACDVLARRLERAQERFRRAGVHNIETRPLSSERDPWVKRHKGMYDAVLVDAPCSGVGVWRRNPDARWRQLGPGLAELVPLQAEILESASRLVKAGGRLVYATCSMLPEENMQQVEKFLQAHPEFRLEGKALELTPAQHDTDGFFGALMVRSPAEAAA